MSMQIEETNVTVKKTIRESLNIPRYSARVIKKIENRPGTWDSNEIGVFDGDKQIGSYTRVYPAFYDTFFPFEHGGKWYALFSGNYTRTELMELPSCKVIGGEPPVEGEGFCPVEFYVPNYVQIHYKEDSLKDKEIFDAQWDIDVEKIDPENHAIDFHYFDFGIVAGCIWGDEWSWKVQHLDLSRVAEGIVTRSEKFGYVWLPPKVKLAAAVNITMESPDWYHVGLAIEKTFDIKPGSKKDYSKFNAMDD